MQMRGIWKWHDENKVDTCHHGLISFWIQCVDIPVILKIFIFINMLCKFIYSPYFCIKFNL